MSSVIVTGNNMTFEVCFSFILLIHIKGSLFYLAGVLIFKKDCMSAL